MPHHWTKIGTAAPKPGDKVYVDEQSGETYVLGNVPGGKTKEAIAAEYGSPVTADDVVFPLKQR